MSHLRYQTPSGISVTRQTSKVPYRRGLRGLLRDLDQFRGCYFSSGYEYPGRYSRWDFGTVKPPLEVISAGRQMTFRALNERGVRILRMLTPVLTQHPHWEDFRVTEGLITGTLKPLPELFSEEERSKQPSAFSILRAFTQEFRHAKDPHLALVGAFGFDLLFQFDPINLRLPREGVKDLHLFLCDQIWFMDRKKEQIVRYDYEFALGDNSTVGVERTGEAVAPPLQLASAPIESDHTPEEYMANVETVRQRMKVGDYYEVVLRQTFRTPYGGRPSELFERIQTLSPSPYEFLIQLGDEALVGASPEMFVRVEGTRIETCPISGTARRTGDPMRDADAIRELLNSPKEESELTMCTDVDRNDKSRVCLPGTVQLIGRRLIESYAGLFHTVDHVEGTLEPGFDSLDAFLTHMWAVTVIGAPKKWAAQAVEDLEKSARGWYGGAVGMIAMNGDINTGITIRTAHLKHGMANYSAGATLLYDSVPEAEEAETRLKATGFFRALGPQAPKVSKTKLQTTANGLKLLLVDNEDCFIHTLANYARQAGASIVTYRWGFPLHLLDEVKPDLLLVSPGPARPADFGVPDLVREAARRGLPVFGVCLGLQGIVEAFGGDLDVLDYPMHGKPSYIRHHNEGVFEGLPERFRVGRYHSLHARRSTLPRELEVTAESEDGIIMGVRHRDLPIEGVQFHPESLLSLEGHVGLELMRNAMLIPSRATLAK